MTRSLHPSLAIVATFGALFDILADARCQHALAVEIGYEEDGAPQTALRAACGDQANVNWDLDEPVAAHCRNRRPCRYSHQP
ncbi:MAG: hypothetical protein ACPGUV_14765 [Polyangiales bacterium]